jgi:GlpG protein
MRLVGHIESQIHAKRFSDFLYSNEIENVTEQDANGHWEIWALDEDHLDKAKSLLEQFTQNPEDSDFIEAARAAGEQKKRAEKKPAKSRARVIDSTTIFYKPPVPYGRLSLTLIAISVVVTIFTQLGNNEPLVKPLLITEYEKEGDYIVWDSSLPEVRHGQVWRLFTPMFLHFGIIHILFNMLWLRDLGSIIEARKGWRVLLLLAFVIAAVSNVAQFLMSGPLFGGMSGVVYGLLGYVWMQGKFNPASNLHLQSQTVRLMIIWFFVCLTGLIGPIANTAHAVGAVIGIVWGYITARLTKIRQSR